MQDNTENTEQDSVELVVDTNGQEESSTGDIFADNLGLEPVETNAMGEMVEPEKGETEEAAPESVEETEATEETTEATEETTEEAIEETTIAEAEKVLEESGDADSVLSHTDAIELLNEAAQERLDMSYDEYRDMQSVDYTSMDKTDALLEYQLAKMAEAGTDVANMSDNDVEEMKEELDYKYSLLNMSDEQKEDYASDNGLTDAQLKDKIMSLRQEFRTSHTEAISGLNEMKSNLESLFNSGGEVEIVDNEESAEEEAPVAEFDPVAYKKEFDEHFQDHKDEVEVDGQKYEVNHTPEQKEKIAEIMMSQNFWKSIGATDEAGNINPDIAFNMIARLMFPEKYTGIGLNQGKEQGRAEAIKDTSNIDFETSGKNQKVTDTEQSLHDQFGEHYRNVK